MVDVHKCMLFGLHPSNSTLYEVVQWCIYTHHYIPYITHKYYYTKRPWIFNSIQKMVCWKSFNRSLACSISACYMSYEILYILYGYVHSHFMCICNGSDADFVYYNLTWSSLSSGFFLYFHPASKTYIFQVKIAGKWKLGNEKFIFCSSIQCNLLEKFCG